MPIVDDGAGSSRKRETPFERKVRTRGQRKVRQDPPQSLTDFQIEGLRRRVSEGNASLQDIGGASRLLSTERLVLNERITAIRTQKIDILEQLKDLRMTIIDTV